MYPFVSFKISRLGKGLPAACTFKGSLSGMYPFVFFKISRLGKGLPAVCTFKGLLSGMHHIMSFKIPDQEKDFWQPGNEHTKDLSVVGISLVGIFFPCSWGPDNRALDELVLF